MKKPSQETIDAILAMDPREIDRIRREEECRREYELAKAARSGDPIGTIRLQHQHAHGERILWVRSSGWRWDPWIEDDHGLSVDDHQLQWATLPVVGMMPPDWVAKAEKYHRLDYGEDD